VILVEAASLGHGIVAATDFGSARTMGEVARNVDPHHLLCDFTSPTTDAGLNGDFLIRS
jgi:hypothetical protein